MTTTLRFGEVFDATKHEYFHAYGNPDCTTPWTFFIEHEDGIQSLPIHGRAHQCGFATKEEALEYQKKLLTAQFFRNYVYMVMKYGETRSSIACVFSTYDKAHRYIMRQPGFYREQSFQVHFGVNIHDELYGSFEYSGYSIEPYPVDAEEWFTVKTDNAKS